MRKKIVVRDKVARRVRVWGPPLGCLLAASAIALAGAAVGVVLVALGGR
jgi:hypothetical protein